MREALFLAQKSETAAEADKQAAVRRERSKDGGNHG